MSKNKFRRQVWILPEDDANRQIAQGFILDPGIQERNIHVENVAGGWAVIRDRFEEEYNRLLAQYPHCFMILLIDFDDRDSRRLENVLSGVDATLRNRVFVLGARSEPERLRASMGMTYETIGKTLARECREGRQDTWNTELLEHNRSELERMMSDVRPILFG